MEITSRSRNFQLMLFTALYFVQGVIQSYQLNFFKPHMASEGVAPNLIGLFGSLAILPFILKIGYGIISDRISLFGLGYRLPYMTVGVTLCAILFGVATFIAPGVNFGLFATILLTAVFAMALFDTTADALAVDITAEEDQSRVQSAMTSGRAIGLILLSIVFGWMADRFGYSSMFLVIGLTLIVPLGLLLMVTEPERRDTHQTFQWRAFVIFRQPAIIVYSFYLIVVWVVFTAIDGLITLYMTELGASGLQVGNFGAIKGIGMVIGAALTHLFITRTGAKAAAFAVGILVGLGGLVVSGLTAIPSFLLFAGIWGVAAGLHWTVYATISMRVTDPRIAGSMFAILMTMSNIGLAVGEGVAVSLTDTMSFPSVFQLFASFTVAVLLLWWLNFRLMSGERAIHAQVIQE